ncbi:MAG: SigB/SigF/SigG family RNA polymerase sigma factor [Streptosporangiaceae bacterium]
MLPRAQLRDLADTALLAQLRLWARDSPERAVICEILVERYAGMVRSCVRKYRGSPVPAEDLMQVGYVGLLKAINNFDPAIGESLSAFAQPCVSGEIKRHFRDKRWQVHVGRPEQELLLEMREATEEMTHQLGRAPVDGELALRLGVTEDDIGEARRAGQVFSAYSLDAPLSDREDAAQLADLLGDDDEAIELAINTEAVNSHLEELPEREQRILVLRFWGNLSQAEIGGRLGISQMHVSRLLSRALAHLKDRLIGEPAGSE